MTTLARPPVPRRPAPAVEPEPSFIELFNIKWETYEAILRDADEQHVRITYDDGWMVLMSPLLPKHERTKKFLGRIIELASLEMNLRISSFGSTTWRKKDVKKGLEPDECYYIQREPRMRKRMGKVNLAKDPPSDLAVEVDVTHHPMKRARVYAGLGVPELWLHRPDRVEFLRLTPKSEYTPIPRSDAMPFLSVNDVNRFLALIEADEHDGICALRDWLRTLPRKPLAPPRSTP